ncbi:MAG: hypothetical protein ACODAD_12955, partial [Planctomycetota bacterium]
MRDFSITEQDIAISKARWEPEFCAVAERSSRLLTSTRRLPIYDQESDSRYPEVDPFRRVDPTSRLPQP